jgi:hypothetical protein
MKTMRDALSENVPPADATKERIEFLLDFAERLRQGAPVGKALMVLADGHSEAFEPGMHHIARGVYSVIKFATILDETQEGDTMTGTLRLRVRPEDRNEALFRIALEPTIGLGEAHIDLTSRASSLKI